MSMAIASFSDSHIRKISEILADAYTHRELSDLLRQCGIAEQGGDPKWERVLLALTVRQKADNGGNNVGSFIQAAMDPARFVGRLQQFANFRDNLNEVLAFSGLHLGEDGKLKPVAQARTLTSAPQCRSTSSQGNTIVISKITEVTRRAIIDFLIIGNYDWAGRLDEPEFLARLFDLLKLPSNDRRFGDAAEDIWKHRVMNRDWSDDWVFYDGRFNLLHGSDETFLRFLCETIHPAVRSDPDRAAEMLKAYNEHLTKDGWEIVEKTRISDRPVYAARPLLEGAGFSLKAAKEVAFTLDADYVSQQITRMEAAINSDPELAIGTAKEFLETICKTILTERRIMFAKDEQLPRLVKLTVEELKLVPDGLTKATEAAESVRVLLKNLAAIGHHLAELRNPFGTGHGKEATYKGLTAQHARLAVGAASALGVFLFECHQKEKGKS